MNPNTVWFWIVVGVGTIAIGAVGKWVWTSQMNALREWLQAPKAAQENAAEAREAAAVAVDHASTLLNAVGHPNGQGDVVTMLTTSLSNQDRMFALLAQRAEWEVAHDEKDEETRVIVDATAADVSAIKDHLGLSGPTA